MTSLTPEEQHILITIPMIEYRRLVIQVFRSLPTHGGYWSELAEAVHDASEREEGVTDMIDRAVIALWLAQEVQTP